MLLLRGVMPAFFLRMSDSKEANLASQQVLKHDRADNVTDVLDADDLILVVQVKIVEIGFFDFDSGHFIPLLFIVLIVKFLLLHVHVEDEVAESDNDQIVIVGDHFIWRPCNQFLS